MPRTLLLLVAALTACASNRPYELAEQRLHVHGHKLHLDAHDRIDGAQVYVFCRRETDMPHHERQLSLLPRRYDGACVTVVCESDDRCTD